MQKIPVSDSRKFLVLSVIFYLLVGILSSSATTAPETKFQMAILNEQGQVLFSPHSCREMNENFNPIKWGLMTLDGTFLIDGENKWMGIY